MYNAHYNMATFNISISKGLGTMLLKYSINDGRLTATLVSFFKINRSKSSGQLCLKYTNSALEDNKPFCMAKFTSSSLKYFNVNNNYNKITSFPEILIFNCNIHINNIFGLYVSLYSTSYCREPVRIYDSFFHFHKFSNLLFQLNMYIYVNE